MKRPGEIVASFSSHGAPMYRSFYTVAGSGGLVGKFHFGLVVANYCDSVGMCSALVIDSATGRVGWVYDGALNRNLE